jgi:hypothetical protein
VRVLALLAAAVLVAGLARGQDRTSSESSWTSSAPRREQLASLEARLERAVSQVSMPHAGLLLGRSASARGYRLPGYGIVFVLTPRALPGKESVFVMRRPHGHPGGAVRVERHLAPVPPGWEPERLEELERQVLVLQHTAEAHRRAAEEDRDRLVHDIRVRVEVEGSEEEATVITHDVTSEGGEGPPDAVFVGEGSGEHGTPPWRFWFEGETGTDERSPETVVGDVKEALLDALDTQGGPVPGLEPDELVTVAIDFVPGGFFESHQEPSKTLILRVRQGDLAARAAGKLEPEELRERVEVIEY